MRFEIRTEVVKHGRKTETSYAVFDHSLNKVVIRYSDKQKAEELIVRLTTATRLV